MHGVGKRAQVGQEHVDDIAQVAQGVRSGPDTRARRCVADRGRRARSRSRCGTAVNSRNAAMIAVRNASGGRGAGLPRVPRCRPCRLSRDAVDTYDGRFEYWDAATETAWGGGGADLRRPRAALPAPRRPVRGGRLPAGRSHRVPRLGRSHPERGRAAPGGAFCRPTRWVAPPGAGADTGRGDWTSVRTTGQTSCWRWTTPPTSTRASSISTRRGGSRENFRQVEAGHPHAEQARPVVLGGRAARACPPRPACG